MNNVTAIILGGGRGTRLFPLTLERAKPAVGFAGKYRLIDIPISNCINSNIKRMFVLTQFLSASLHRHIMQTYQFDLFSGGYVDILAAEQTPHSSDWFQGTADAVRATLNHTMYFGSDELLILSGDHLYRMDYREMIRHHKAKNADITIGVYPVPKSEASALGLMQVDSSGFVTEFVEKPKDPNVINRLLAPSNLFECHHMNVEGECCLANMGIYAFRPSILKDLLMSTSKTDFGKDIIPSALKTYKVVAYPFSDYWKDIGTIGAFFDANISLAQENPPFNLYRPDWPIYTRTRSLPPSRVIRSKIRDSLLVEGSDINGAYIKNSIVGTRSQVRSGTDLTQVVMLGADFYDKDTMNVNMDFPQKDLPPLGIGKNCMIERAIIDKNAHIGDDVEITSKEGQPDSEGGNYWIRDGITIIPKGAVLPPGTKI
ncbi:glucose-1-phosphate adenylyltransferase [candidate division KSB1 bacterium]|nr:glucose-1-phosphate adenylyltransferase [candidate division KSB1 bacterium]